MYSCIGKCRKHNLAIDCKLDMFDKIVFWETDFWCLKHYVSHLPATVSRVTVFLGSFVQESVSELVLKEYVYSLKWYHELNECVNNVCDSKLLHVVMEGGKRIHIKILQTSFWNKTIYSLLCTVLRFLNVTEKVDGWVGIV